MQAGRRPLTEGGPRGYAEAVRLFDALSHPARIRIAGVLSEGRQYVSELARLVGISRPLLYMHLKKLEAAGLVTGSLELGEGGKAAKYFSLADFDWRLTPGLLAALSQEITPEDCAQRAREGGKS